MIKNLLTLHNHFSVKLLFLSQCNFSVVTIHLFIQKEKKSEEKRNEDAKKKKKKVVKLRPKPKEKGSEIIKKKR